MLKRFFNEEAAVNEFEKSDANLALMLILEIALADGKLDRREFAEIQKFVKKNIYNDHDNNEINSLIQRKYEISKDSTSIYETVKLINLNFKVEAKIELLSILWKIIVADSEVDPYEENLYFRIAELLNIKRSTANKIKQQNF
jgi:uncharacterized tellurite resistance protein B-like protein